MYPTSAAPDRKSPMGIFFVGDNPEDSPTGSTLVSELCPSLSDPVTKKAPSAGAFSCGIVAEAGFCFLSQNSGKCSGCKAFVDGCFRRFMKNKLFSVRVLSELAEHINHSAHLLINLF